MPKSLNHIPAHAEGDAVFVVIETPKGSRNKYAYAEELGAMQLKGVLPEGTSFPYDYGYVPSTKGGDGDALDILVIMDAPAFAGCVIEAKLIGVIEAEQKEPDGHWDRNDRLIGVATHARTHEHIGSLSDLRPQMIEEIEGFFQHYNRLAGKEFRPARRSGPSEAMRILEDGITAFKKG